VTLAAGVEAQAPPPERLYETGALRAAAEGFSRLTESEPNVAAYWYGLGASYYRLGMKGAASAAWLRARRLEPRNATVRRALRLTPPPDATTARRTWSPPVTPEELLLIGIVGWVAGWIGWVLRPRHRHRWAILLAVAGGATLAGFTLRSWYRKPIAIVLDPTTMRVSPHGRAPDLGPLEAGGAVRLLRWDRNWVLVEAAGSREGWIVSDAIAVIGG
jgi:tetratricopeptide (TPR) repeat protein